MYSSLLPGVSGIVAQHPDNVRILSKYQDVDTTYRQQSWPPLLNAEWYLVGIQCEKGHNSGDR
jgi:hypothetical protein